MEFDHVPAAHFVIGQRTNRPGLCYGTVPAG
jgi:hypothetical protein